MGQHETRLSPTSVNGQRERSNLASAPKLPPETLEFLAVSLKKRWKCYRKQLRKCQRKFSERSVHDLRVEARRLHSLLELLASFLAPGRLKRAQCLLKRHLDTFDDLRDTQVQLPVVRKFRKEFPAAGSFYRFLKKCAARLSRSTCKKARGLRSKPLNKLMTAARNDVKWWLRAAGPRQPNPLLLSAINQAFTLTRKRKDEIGPDDTQSIHCTRVAFKHFRYVIEALALQLPEADEALLARMHDYQTLMGDIQDAEVLLRAFQKFMRKDNGEIKPELRFERALQERRRGLISKYLAAADQLFDFWPLPGGYLRNRGTRASGNGHSRRRPKTSLTRPKRALSEKKNL